MNANLPEIFEKFLYSMEFARGLSKKTIKAYRNNLECLTTNMFNSNLEINIDDIRALKVDDYLINWLMKLKNEGMKEKSLNQRISTVRSLYTYLIGEQLLSINIAKSIPLFPERDVEEKQPLTVEESWMLLNAAEKELKNNYTYENLRNLLCINLFLGIGVRVEELSLLDFSNFDLVNKKVILRYDQVKGKKKGRSIAIPDSVIEIYNKYLEYRLPLNENLPENLHEAVFVSRNHNRLSIEMIRVDLKKIAHKCNLNISCHHLRHTYASILVNCSDAELHRVSKNLGHSNIDLTNKRYVHDGEDNTAKVNPIFNKKTPQDIKKESKPIIKKEENSNVIQISFNNII